MRWRRHCRGGMGGAGIAAGSILSPEDVLPGTPAQPRPSAFSEATQTNTFQRRPRPLHGTLFDSLTPFY